MIGGRHRVGRGDDVRVGLGATAESLGEDGRPGIRDGVRRVLGDALVGVGVAALEDERDATDERDHRERGDDDDLAPLGAPIAWTRAVRCMVSSCVGSGEDGRFMAASDRLRHRPRPCLR